MDKHAVRASLLRKLMVIAALVTILASSPAPALAALEPDAFGPAVTGRYTYAQRTDWILAKATSTRSVRIESPFRVYGRRTGTGPLVVGVGLASRGGPDPHSWFQVTRIGGGPPEVSVSVGPTAERVPFTLSVTEDGRFTLQPVSVDDRAKILAVAFFVVNGTIERLDWKPRSPAGSVRSSVRSGTGARSLYVGRPTDGVSATAAGWASGSVTFNRRPVRGIVGAMEESSCLEGCAGTWRPPDGVAQTWVTTVNAIALVCLCVGSSGVNTTFAGPSGQWQWRWSGSSSTSPGQAVSNPATVTGRPVAAAYAPIGSDWKLFRNCRPTADCLTSGMTVPGSASQHWVRLR
ncbi:MAG: hypothetical protein R3246_11185 [Acidimicrobiia bacterium]|nr:hypothetical protein [Acidimicrobiia bacterium]